MSKTKKKMNEVILLQVKTHWSTLKEFDCITQTQNCEINTLPEKILCLHIKETIFTTLSNRYIFRNSSGVFEFLVRCIFYEHQSLPV